MSAFLYAYFNQYPILLNEVSPPDELERFSPDLDLSILNIENKKEIWNTPADKKEVGIPKIALWNRLKFILSMSGLMICPNPADFIRLEENIFKFGFKNKVYKMDFDNAHIFSAKNLEGAEWESKSSDDVIIKDWISVRAGANHKFDYCSTGDDFVGEVFFYPSRRNDVIKGTKDIFVTSRLKKENVMDPDFSDTMVRFRVKKLMRDLGIRGPKNGKNPNYPHSSSQEFKYRAIRLEFRKREICPEPSVLFFEDSRLIFQDFDLENFIKEVSQAENVFENMVNYLSITSHTP